MDRNTVIKALECIKNADKRCGNPCEDTGFCHYATAVRGLDNEIYRPFICDRERICTDAVILLKEQETGHWIYLENCSNSGVYCSECHTKVFDNYPFKKKFSYFCPHCGTRMEGETERR